MSRLVYILAIAGLLCYACVTKTAATGHNKADTIIITLTDPFSDYDNDTIDVPGSIAVNDTLMVSDTLMLNDTLLTDDNLLLNDTIRVTDTIPGSDPVNGNDKMQEEEEEEEEEPKPSNWSKGLQTSLSFSQISLSNWSAGGQNSVSFNSQFNAFINYKTPDNRITWENTLDLGYGLINQENKGTIKSDDKIDFSTKLGRRASEDWFYSSLINFRTQWTTGYKSPGDTLKISNFMAPGYLNVSVGMDHKFDDHINFYLSPLAGRVVYVKDEDLSNLGAFGVEKGETIRYEFGGFVRIQFRATLIENISVNSKLELFSNYLDKPKNFNVNSDTRINMQITRLISANLLIQLVYDENARIRLDEETTLGPRIQLKQVFGLGLSYRI